MNAFKAFRIHEREGKIAAGFEQMSVDALTAGDVVIRVKYSSINFKDALAATGAGKILRKYPLNGGIDLAGEVASSTDARYKPGEQVLVTGCGHSETLDGGYAEYARAQGDSVIPLPAGLSAFDAMALGTAGFTTGPRDPSHGAERAEALDGPDRRDGRFGRRRLDRDRPPVEARL